MLGRFRKATEMPQPILNSTGACESIFDDLSPGRVRGATISAGAEFPAKTLDKPLKLLYSQPTKLALTRTAC